MDKEALYMRGLIDSIMSMANKYPGNLIQYDIDTIVNYETALAS